MCLYELETTDGLSVLLFYDVRIDSVATLNQCLNVEPYRPTVTVWRHHHWHCWLCSYCHNIASAMHLAFYKSSIPRVYSIPCSASYTLSYNDPLLLFDFFQAQAWGLGCCDHSFSD